MTPVEFWQNAAGVFTFLGLLGLVGLFIWAEIKTRYGAFEEWSE